MSVCGHITLYSQTRGRSSQLASSVGIGDNSFVSLGSRKVLVGVEERGCEFGKIGAGRSWIGRIEFT
jgi:hypothetical protein